jgi:hypothetical protein
MLNIAFFKYTNLYDFQILEKIQSNVQLVGTMNVPFW